jgi:hypothetical protein
MKLVVMLLTEGDLEPRYVIPSADVVEFHCSILATNHADRPRPIARFHDLAPNEV